MQRRPPRGPTDPSPGLTEEALQTALGRELPGPPGEREPGPGGSGRSPLSVRPTQPGAPGQGSSVSSLGSEAQSRPLDLRVTGGLWQGPRDAVQVSHFKHGRVPVDQAAPQAASRAC